MTESSPLRVNHCPIHSICREYLVSSRDSGLCIPGSHGIQQCHCSFSRCSCLRVDVMSSQVRQVDSLGTCLTYIADGVLAYFSCLLQQARVFMCIPCHNTYLYKAVGLPDSMGSCIVAGKLMYGLRYMSSWQFYKVRHE